MPPRPALPHLLAGPVLLVALGLPLLGVQLVDREVPGLFDFPPRLRMPQDYPHFAWWSVPAVGGGLLLLIAPLLVACRRRKASPPAASPRPAAPRPLPAWGWLALVWTVGWWGVAWTRHPALVAVQPYTFFPLWLGVIMVLNAIASRRGRPTMIRAPGCWLGLFLLSSVFWWGFEWLNRFVRNWHYLGVERFDAVGYALHASLCFSTVLPAVLAVRECWPSPGRGGAKREPGWSLSRTGMRRSAAPTIGLAAIALVLMGAFPEGCYPLLWLAPLTLGLGWAFWWHPDRLRWWQRGDWRPVAAWGAAGLVCGIGWELWNVYSMPKWIYTVPYVERWRVFEMPLLGYAGYVPFGWCCGLVVGWRLSPRPVEAG